MKKYMVLFAVLLLVFAAAFVSGPVWGRSLAQMLDVDEDVVVNAAKALPQTTQSAIFTIVGGPIEILSLTGEVTTVIQTQANSIDIVANPTAGVDTGLAAALNISAHPVGTFYSMVTSITTALASYTGGIGPTMGGVFSVVVPVGAIEVGATASNTGNVTWRLRYRPLHQGVVVTAN